MLWYARRRGRGATIESLFSCAAQRDFCDKFPGQDTSRAGHERVRGVPVAADQRPQVLTWFTALITAFSEAAVILGSMPTPQTWLPWPSVVCT